MPFCIRLPHFNLIGPLTAEMWGHFDSTGRTRSLNTTSGFLLLDAAVFGKSKSISKPNFVDIMSIHGWNITTTVLEKQTSALLDFDFRFQLWHHHRNVHVILHQATKCRLNRSTYCGTMTSFQVVNMAAAAAKFYFRFRICWCICLQKVKVYQKSKFRRHISIDSWNITTSVL